MQGVTKNAVDRQDNLELMEQWKDMAIKTNNNSLLAEHAKGSLAPEELFYYLDYFSSMN